MGRYRHGRYESFVLDVVRDVDRRFPTVADRRRRVIAGNSEGAYAAANLGLRHLRHVRSAGGMVGLLPADSHRCLRENSRRPCCGATAPPTRFAVSTDRSPGGRCRHTSTPAGRTPDVVQLAPFAAELRAAGAHVEACVLPGRHDWRLWRAQTPRCFAGHRPRWRHDDAAAHRDRRLRYWPRWR